MASIQSVLRVRDGGRASLECIAEAFNTMHNLIVQSGMIQVSDSDFSGQAKLFSASADVGVTQVSHPTTTPTNLTNGYKVYKHPTLALYVKVSFIVAAQSALTTATFVRFKYQFSTELNGLGGFNLSKTSIDFFTTELYYSSSSSYGITTSQYPTSYEKITVSCGFDHFWTSRDLGVSTLQYSACHSLPERLDINSFGIFKSHQDDNILCVVYQQLADGDSYNGLLKGSAVNNQQAQYSCLRYMLCNYGAWSLLDSGAAGQLDNPRVTNTMNGVRVAQGKLVVNGDFHRFNFGFIPYKALANFSVITLNMNGISQKYQALPYMGFASHAPPSTDFWNMSSPIFPLVG